MAKQTKKQETGSHTSQHEMESPTKRETGAHSKKQGTGTRSTKAETASRTSKSETASRTSKSEMGEMGSQPKKRETGSNISRRESGEHLTKRERQDQHPDFFHRIFGNEFLHNFFEGDVPAINVKENNNALMLEVSVPGYSKDDFRLYVDRNVLTISGRKTMEKEEKGKDSRILKQEFSSSSFSRSFTLPEHIDTTNIDATQKDGILKITLPKLETAKEDKTKRIEIR